MCVNYVRVLAQWVGNGFEIMSDCIHVRKTGYQNFRKQLKHSFRNLRFCINLGLKLVKIRLRFSRTVPYLVSQ